MNEQDGAYSQDGCPTPSIASPIAIPVGAPASRRENRSQLTSLARNGYIQSHTVSSTHLPQIFLNFCRILFFLPLFSQCGACRFGFSVVSLTLDVYSLPKFSSSSSSSSSIFREKTRTKMYRRALADARTAQRCLTRRRSRKENDKEGNSGKGGLRERYM